MHLQRWRPSNERTSSEVHVEGRNRGLEVPGRQFPDVVGVLEEEVGQLGAAVAEGLGEFPKSGFRNILTFSSKDQVPHEGCAVGLEVRHDEDMELRGQEVVVVDVDEEVDGLATRRHGREQNPSNVGHPRNPNL